MNSVANIFLQSMWEVISSLVLPMAIIVLLIAVIISVRNNKNSTSNSPDVSVQLIRKDLWYLIIIFGILLIFILVLALCGDQSAFEYFSFTSTITSTVLSVIAIIMTIINEQKSDRVRAAIEESVEELKAAGEQVKEYGKQIKTQRKTLDGLVAKMDENLKRTKELLNQTTELKQEFREISRDKEELDTANYADLDADLEYQLADFGDLGDDLEDDLDDDIEYGLGTLEDDPDDDQVDD